MRTQILYKGKAEQQAEYNRNLKQVYGKEVLLADVLNDFARCK